MQKTQAPEVLIKEILRLINLSMSNLEYIGATQWIFGILQKDTPVQTVLANQLIQEQDKYLNIYESVKQVKKDGKSVRISDSSEHLKGFQEVLQATQETKNLYKNGPLKILCSDEKIVNIASEIVDKGMVNFSKTEVEKIFDFSRVIEFWDRIPDYATILLGGGVRISLPEIELFEIMACCYDEAYTTHQEMRAYQKKISSSQEAATEYLKLARRNSILNRQTVIHAFLLLEAFINSIAYVSLTDKTKNFSQDERLYLSEQSKDKNGKLVRRFVSIENKLCDWVKLVSPTRKTFDKGKKPFQEFKLLKQYRDSIVHLSDRKVGHFRAIDFAIAAKAVLTTLEMIKKTCEYTSPHPKNVEYPFWLIEPGADGLIRFSPEIEIGLNIKI